MNAEFQWWLLILGIVIGGALVYLVMADLRTDDADGQPPGDETEPWDDETEPSAPRDPDMEGDRPQGEPTVADLP